MKFRQYLKSILKTFEISKQAKRKFVLGNQSADYDSIFGSLIYAYFLTLQLNITFLPLIDCSKSDILLRLQVMQIMNKYDIYHEDLLYRDQVTFNLEQDQFYLYDHNHRQNLNIKQIIDHHTFQIRQNSPSQNNRIICTSGSALTLLFYLYNPTKIPQTSNNISLLYDSYWQKNQKLQVEYDPVVEQIMRYGILLDSFNFDQSQKERWTQADKEAVRLIEQRHKFQITYEQLSDFKFDQERNLQLSLEQHLKKDYKQLAYEKLGIIEYSIIYLNPDIFIKKYGDQLLSLFKDKKYSCYMLMFIWKNQNGSTQRQALFSVNQQYAGKDKKITQKVQQSLTNLKMNAEKPFHNWQRWKDPKATISRKKIDNYFRQKL